MDRVGDFTDPVEKVDRVGEGMFGPPKVDLVGEGTSGRLGACGSMELPRLRYRSPGSSILSRGLQNICKAPSKSVGARICLSRGNPPNAMALARIPVATSSSASVNSQCRVSRVEDATYGCRKMTSPSGKAKDGV